MLFHEAVQFPCSPVHHTMLTQSEIEDLFSLINKSRDPASLLSGSQGSNRTVYSSEEKRSRKRKTWLRTCSVVGERSPRLMEHQPMVKTMNRVWSSWWNMLMLISRKSESHTVL
ncbi:hypothetical protein ACSQ67_018550 [Phaseolus vulgaris]